MHANQCMKRMLDQNKQFILIFLKRLKSCKILFEGGEGLYNRFPEFLDKIEDEVETKKTPTNQ